MAVATAQRKSSPPPKPEARKTLAINIEFEDRAKLLLREYLDKTDNDYASLADKLNEMGVEISARGLENKISRGGFSAAFMPQCFEALNCCLEMPAAT